MDARFEQFLKFCKGHSASAEILKLVNKRFLEADKNYIDSTEFLSLVDSSESKISAEVSRFFVHLRDFLSVLKDHKAESAELSVHRSVLDGGNSDSDSAFVSAASLRNCRSRSSSQDSACSAHNEDTSKGYLGKKRNKCEDSDSDPSVNQEVKRKKLGTGNDEASEDDKDDCEEEGNDKNSETGSFIKSCIENFSAENENDTYKCSNENETASLNEKYIDDFQDHSSNNSGDSDEGNHQVNNDGLGNNRDDDVRVTHPSSVEHGNDDNDVLSDSDEHICEQNSSEIKDREDVIDCEQLNASPVTLPSLSQGSWHSETEISDQLPLTKKDSGSFIDCLENTDAIDDKHKLKSDVNNTPDTDNNSMLSDVSLSSVEEGPSWSGKTILPEKSDDSKSITCASNEKSVRLDSKPAAEDALVTDSFGEDVLPADPEHTEDLKSQQLDTLSQESSGQSKVTNAHETEDIIIIDSQNSDCYVTDAVDEDQKRIHVQFEDEGLSEIEHNSSPLKNNKKPMISLFEVDVDENNSEHDLDSEGNSKLENNAEERFEILESDEEIIESDVAMGTSNARLDDCKDNCKDVKPVEENNDENGVTELESDEEMLIASVEREVSSIRINRSTSRSDHGKGFNKGQCISTPKSARKSLNLYDTSSDEEDPDYAEKARKFREKQKKRYKISVGKKKKRPKDGDISCKKESRDKRITSALLQERDHKHSHTTHGKTQSSHNHYHIKRNSPKSHKKSPTKPKSPAILIMTDSDSDEYEMNVEQLKKKVEEKQNQEWKEMFNIFREPVIRIEKIAIKIEVKDESDAAEENTSAARETAMDSHVNIDQEIPIEQTEALKNEKGIDNSTINTHSVIERDGYGESNFSKEKKRAEFVTCEKCPDSNESVSKAFVEIDKALVMDEESDEEEKALGKHAKLDQEHSETKERHDGKTNNDEKPGSSDGNKEQAKKGSSRQIRKLEALLESIRDEIEKVRSRELSLDDLESDVSDYLLEDKLQRKFVKVYNKLCELHEAKSYTGRPTEKYFRYQGTRYKAVNRKIERFVNKRKVFPDYHDIRNLILKVNKDERLNLRARDIDDLAREAFTDVGNQLQKRRQKDFVSSFHFPGSDVNAFSMYDDPALFDTDLKKKLDHNKKTGKTKMDQIVEKYAHLQYEVGDKTDEDEDEEEEVGGGDQDEPVPGVDCSDNEGDSRDGLLCVGGTVSSSTSKPSDDERQKYGMDICITAGKDLKQKSPSLEIENVESGETKSFVKKTLETSGEDVQRDYFENLGLKRKADALVEDVCEDVDAKRVKIDAAGGTVTELDTESNMNVDGSGKMENEKGESVNVTILSDDDDACEDFALEVNENSESDEIEVHDDDSTSTKEKKVEEKQAWTDVMESSKPSADLNVEDSAVHVRQDRGFLRLESVEILPDKNDDVPNNVDESVKQNKSDIDLIDEKKVRKEETVVLETGKKKKKEYKTSDDNWGVNSVKEEVKIKTTCKESQGPVSGKESAIPTTKPEIIVIGEIDLTDDSDVIAIPSDDEEDNIQMSENPLNIKIVSACSINSKKDAVVKITGYNVHKNKNKTSKKSQSQTVPKFQNSAIENLNKVMQEKWHEEPCKPTIAKNLINNKHYVSPTSNDANQLARFQNNVVKSPHLSVKGQGSKFKSQSQPLALKGQHTTVLVQNLIPLGCNVSPVKGQISTFQGERLPLKGQVSPLKGQGSPLIAQSSVASQGSPTKFSWETTKISPSAASTMIATKIMQKNTSFKSRQLVNIQNLAASCKRSKLSAPLQESKPTGLIGSVANAPGAYQKINPTFSVRGSVAQNTGMQLNRNGMACAPNMQVGRGNSRGLQGSAPLQQPYKPAKPISNLNIPRKPLVPDVILIDGDDKTEGGKKKSNENVGVVVLDSLNSSGNSKATISHNRNPTKTVTDNSKATVNSNKDTVVQSKLNNVNASELLDKDTEKETEIPSQADPSSLESVSDIFDDIESPVEQGTDYVVELNAAFDESDSESDDLVKDIKKENLDSGYPSEKTGILEDKSSVCKKGKTHVDTKCLTDQNSKVITETQVGLEVLVSKSVKYLDVDISSEMCDKSPSVKLCDNATNNYGIEEITSTSNDTDQVHKTKRQSPELQKKVEDKKSVGKTRISKPLQSITPNKSSPSTGKAIKSTCLWSDDENAGIIETYSEPDSTPYALEEGTISSSGQVIVLSDSE